MKIRKDQIVLESTEDRELIFESLYLYYLRCYELANSNSLLLCKKVLDRSLYQLIDKINNMIAYFDDVSFSDMPCIKNEGQ